MSVRLSVRLFPLCLFSYGISVNLALACNSLSVACMLFEVVTSSLDCTITVLD